MAVRIGITMGDPAGIGPEVICRAVRKPLPGCRYVVIGDAGVLERAGGLRPARGSAVSVCDLANAPGAGTHDFPFGKVSGACGKASMQYLDHAMALLADKQIDCLVTAPISKEAINLAGYDYSGHTEYFAKRVGVGNPLMMLLNDRLRFGLVTRHIPLAQVPAEISYALLAGAAAMTFDTLRTFFGISRPRVCVCALNPHASDNGVIGREENALIKPAVRKLSRRFTGLTGPLPADSAIAKAAAGEYDCLLALYHDQALIPLKLTGAASGVNLTAGLGFVRTSPLHGTAFDIAGRHKADASSMRAAIACAYRCCKNQKKA